jgi:hypothetical protein
MSAHMAMSLRAPALKPNEAILQRVKDAYAALAAGPAISSVLCENLREKASTVRTRNDGRHWSTPLDFRVRAAGLPTTKFESVDWTHPVVDAPCAAAAIAQGGLSWSLEVERAIRMCRAFDPNYFEDALLLSLTIGSIGVASTSAMAS